MSSRLQDSIEDMAEFCPNFTFERLHSAGFGGGIWSGCVQPIRTLEEIEFLLDDIHHNRPIYGAPHGEVRHLPSCSAQHCHHDWMDRTGELTRSFEILVWYNGTREQPRCWINSPAIPREKRRHMWGEDNSICPLLASDDAWMWDRHTVADFIPHVSVWLVSWMVSDRTGVWITGEHGNTPEYHLKLVRPNELCWCRSGRKYRKCHMRQDQHAAALRRIRVAI